MGDEEKFSLKKEDDKNPIKEEILEEEGKKLSRDIARKYIYVRNKERYPLPFEEYKIHHIDGRLFNDSVNNLYLCTKEQRNAIYSEQLKRGKPFTSSKEIDIFLEKIGRNSSDISKDKKIYQKSDTRVPIYWRQRETRQRQTPIREDPHPELREHIVKEIREAEEVIEEKQEETKFYSLPPKPRPELKKQLIEEIREAEDKQKGIHRRRFTRLEKTIMLIGVIAVIGIFIFVVRDSIFNPPQEIQIKPFNISNSVLIPISSSEQLFNYEIRIDRYFMLITNNQDEDLNLQLKYNRYSEALDINENRTMQTHIPAEEQILLKDPGFSRDLGCLKEDCEVSIISSKRI